MYCISEKYYFDEQGTKVIPTKDQIKEFYKDKLQFTAVSDGMIPPSYGVQRGHAPVIDYPYDTLQEAERAAKEQVEIEVNYLMEQVG